MGGTRVVSITGREEALAAAAALRAAASLGVTEHLAATPVDARGLARECGLSERASQALLAALAALDMVEPTTGASYRAAPAANLVGAAVELFDGPADAVTGPYDVVLVANFCHLFGAETNLRLLRRLRQLLIPGGRLGIIDVVPGEAHSLPSQIAFHELSLLLRTSGGAAHRFSAYVDWLTRCGYRSIERVELDPPTQLTLVLAILD